MKIIGKGAEGTYIVEATAHELANAAGHRVPSESTGWKPDHNGYMSGAFPIGTKFRVTDAHKYMQELRDNEQKVRESAAQLKALAQMISAALPTTVVPPATGEKAAEPAL